MRSLKVSIFGAGGTGGEIAEALAMRGNVEIVLLDIQEDLAIGKAMDIGQSAALLGKDFSIQGGSDALLTANSDIVVITAGKGRQPGLKREDLLRFNSTIIEEISRNTAKLSPNAFIIVLTNPADILARIAQQASQFPHHRVMGQGGVLDSARMRTWVAQALGVSIRDVHAMVLGGHGDDMVPAPELVSVNGAPARYLLTDEQWQRIVSRTRYGGGEILARFQTHGAAVTPGWAVAEMIDALCSDIPRLLPVSAFAGGAYDLPDVYVGLPVLLSRRGIERIVEFPLNPDSLDALRKSAAHMDAVFLEWSASR